jgi:hypothetical protein
MFGVYYCGSGVNTPSPSAFFHPKSNLVHDLEVRVTKSTAQCWQHQDTNPTHFRQGPTYQHRQNPLQLKTGSGTIFSSFFFVFFIVLNGLGGSGDIQKTIRTSTRQFWTDLTLPNIRNSIENVFLFPHVTCVTWGGGGGFGGCHGTPPGPPGK